MRIYKNISKRLKKERAARKLTQKDLAKKCKLSRITVLRSENLIFRPNLTTMLKFAKYFKTTLNDLCGIEEKLTKKGNNKK